MKSSPNLERRAAYLELADELRLAIRNGEYSGDRPLPTESSLTEKYGLSRQTVRRAYLELVSEGLVNRVPGRGTFVSNEKTKYFREFDSVEDLIGFSTDTSVEIVKPLSRGVNIETAARLSLDGDVVHSVEYVRSHGGNPFAWTTVSVPPAVADLLEQSAELRTVGISYPLTVIGLLEGRLADPIAVAEQTISAVSADQRIVDRLGCGLNVPILRIDRLFLDATERPVELSVGYFLPDQYTYRTRLSRERRHEQRA